MKARKNLTRKPDSLWSDLVSWQKLILLMLAAACLLSLVAANYYRMRYVQIQNHLNTYLPNVWQPGDIIVDDRFAFSFNGIRADKVDAPGFWELKTGEHFVVVNMSFKNSSSQTYQLSPVRSMTIQGEDGNTYAVSSAVSIQNSLGGPVLAGQTAKGEVGFTMPENVKKGQFIFDPGLADAQLIRVDITIP